MIPTPVHAPDISVTLIKLVGRTTLDGGIHASDRFRQDTSAQTAGGSQRRIDLTPFLADGMPVTVQKSTREPAGAFSFTLADKADPSGAVLESVYGRVEPMDGIEIRMRHGAPAGERLPIVMRGFVSSVQRSEALDGEGRPLRSVTIAGQDFGKLWQILQVVFLPGNVLGDALLTQFRLFERFGTALGVMRSDQFVAAVVDSILTPHLQGIVPEGADWPRAFKLDMRQDRGTVNVGGSQNQEGTIYSILATFTDVAAGFNEIYTEDREDGVYVVFRPNPARGLDGKPIIPEVARTTTASPAATVEVELEGAGPGAAVEGSTTPAGTREERQEREPAAPVPIPADAIVRLSMGRSDAAGANFYWVDAPRMELVAPQLQLNQALAENARQWVDQGTYVNSHVALYGLRMMRTQSQMGDSAEQTFSSGLPAAENAAREARSLTWLEQKVRELALINRDNVLLEQGQAVVKGDPELRAGIHVRIQRGAFAFDAYVPTVVQSWTPFAAFVTSLTLERGMGFAERVRFTGGGNPSPYLAELATTPVRPRQAGTGGRPSRAEVSTAPAQAADAPPAAAAPTIVPAWGSPTGWRDSATDEPYDPAAR